MRVLIAHNEYGRPSGEEDAIRAIAQLLENGGHTVSWFLRSSAAIQSRRDKAQAFFSGIHNPRAAQAISQTIRREMPDLVHAQNLYPLLSPSILPACRSNGVPVVMRCPNYRLFCPNSLHLSHGQICERCLGGKEYWCLLRNCESDWVKSLGYALRTAAARLTRRITANVTTFIVLSEFQRQRFMAAGIPPERIETLPNVAPGLNEESRDEEPGELISFIGRVSPEKGVDDFSAAARALPSLPFAVAGSTARMPELVSSSPPNVRWLGHLKEPELIELYLRSRVVVMPSRCFEGFPNVITRAMALRRPVVASRLGGVPEIVEDGWTGLLFEAGNVEDMVDKIRRLYFDPKLCREMGLAGRLKAQTHYGPKVVYDQLMSIYEKALQRAV
jgi:glycosyltransferase involved in cell wall biosynthesis